MIVNVVLEHAERGIRLGNHPDDAVRQVRGEHEVLKLFLHELRAADDRPQRALVHEEGALRRLAALQQLLPVHARLGQHLQPVGGVPPGEFEAGADVVFGLEHAGDGDRAVVDHRAGEVFLDDEGLHRVDELVEVGPYPVQVARGFGEFQEPRAFGGLGAAVGEVDRGVDRRDAAAVLPGRHLRRRPVRAPGHLAQGHLLQFTLGLQLHSHFPGPHGALFGHARTLRGLPTKQPMPRSGFTARRSLFCLCDNGFRSRSAAKQLRIMKRASRVSKPEWRP